MYTMKTKDNGFDWIRELMKQKLSDNFTGNLQINFYMGGISNINIVESIKLPKK